MHFDPLTRYHVQFGRTTMTYAKRFEAIRVGEDTHEVTGNPVIVLDTKPGCDRIVRTFPAPPPLDENGGTCAVCGDYTDFSEGSLAEVVHPHHGSRYVHWDTCRTPDDQLA